MDRLRTQIRAADIYARDDIDTQARRYGEGLAVGLTIADIAGWDEALIAATEADIMAAAQAVFDRRSAVTGWLTRSDPAREPTE